MPKSKRSKLVSLTKTKKKGKEWKKDVIKRIRETVSKYERIVVFQVANLRTVKFQELREQHKDTSKFLLPPKRLTQIALGKDAASEYAPNLHKLAESLEGNMGLLCTDLETSKAVDLLENFNVQDYARMGEPAIAYFSLQAGPLKGPHGKFQHTLEPTFRELGLPTKLERGEIILLKDIQVCSAGEILTVQQANLLRLFEIKMSSFTLTPVATFEQGTLTLLSSHHEENEESLKLL